MADDPKDIRNPKDVIGSDKIPLSLWPATATALGCLALLDGMLKYGKSNYRAAPNLRASIYIDAVRRHIDAYAEGEDYAPDSGIHHLGHALAGIAILIDAEAADNLEDDRALPGGYRKFIDKLTPMVGILKKKHEGSNPRHFTIADKEDEC